MRIRRWGDWGLSTKIIAVSFAVAVPIVGIIAIFILPRVERAIYDEKILATKNLVEVTYALIAEYDARVHKGEFSLEEGQKRAAGRIQQLRYNEKEYFWINDLTPTMIMHPFKPELNGKDISDMKSPDGRRIFIEMADLCRQNGEGALEYLWPRPGEDKPVPKVSYLKLYRPWGWIVGSGTYVDDINAQMNALRVSVLLALGLGLALAITIGALVGQALKRRVTGLVRQVKPSREALINQQMKMALDKIAFLPFGRLIDQWRWKVFSGEITPENYNSSWWELRRKYQGITPPVPRTEADFDPGAKFHIPDNTPYTRYFLSFILQFQFHKALCEAAGHKGPLYECSNFNSKAAGEKFQAMLAQGASAPWQDTLEKLTGSRQIDAAAITEYFQPLMQWLATENKGQQCGW